jgi:hypothetical protein
MYAACSICRPHVCEQSLHAGSAGSRRAHGRSPRQCCVPANAPASDLNSSTLTTLPRAQRQTSYGRDRGCSWPQPGSGRAAVHGDPAALTGLWCRNSDAAAPDRSCCARGGHAPAAGGGPRIGSGASRRIDDPLYGIRRWRLAAPRRRSCGYTPALWDILAADNVAPRRVDTRYLPPAWLLRSLAA